MLFEYRNRDQEKTPKQIFLNLNLNLDLILITELIENQHLSTIFENSGLFRLGIKKT